MLKTKGVLFQTAQKRSILDFSNLDHLIYSEVS